jgi:chromosomal replication initiation ATPase DnaA
MRQIVVNIPDYVREISMKIHINGENHTMEFNSRKYDKNDVLKKVEDITGVSTEQIKSASQKREIVTARHLIAYILVKVFKYSLHAAGAAINKDHSTVLCAVRSAQNHIDTNDMIFMEKYNQLIQRM